MAGGNVTDSHGETFSDENLKLKHHKRGILSMNNSGPDTNSSQFLVTFGETPWLDGYHVVVGELVEGEDVLSAVEKEGSRTGKTKEVLKIEDCGEVKH